MNRTRYAHEHSVKYSSINGFIVVEALNISSSQDPSRRSNGGAITALMKWGTKFLREATTKGSKIVQAVS